MTGRENPDFQIPVGPIEEPPWAGMPGGEATYRAALDAVFSGVELGAYDRRIIAWLAGWDTPTVATLCSLVMRARAVSRAMQLKRLHARRAKVIAEHYGDPENLRHVLIGIDIAINEVGGDPRG